MQGWGLVAAMFWLLCFTALALSADGFAAGLALGLRGVRVRGAAQLAVGIVSAAFAAAAILAGTLLRGLVPDGAERWLGAGLLALLGSWSILRAWRPSRPPESGSETAKVLRNPAESDLDHSGAIDLREAVLLAFSLSVDMLGAGVGLALGRPALLWLMPPAVGVMQLACLSAGAAIGRRLRRLPVPRAALEGASGVLLLILAGTRLLV